VGPVDDVRGGASADGNDVNGVRAASASQCDRSGFESQRRSTVQASQCARPGFESQRRSTVRASQCARPGFESPGRRKPVPGGSGRGVHAAHGPSTRTRSGHTARVTCSCSVGTPQDHACVVSDAHSQMATRASHGVAARRCHDTLACRDTAAAANARAKTDRPGRARQGCRARSPQGRVHGVPADRGVDRVFDRRASRQVATKLTAHGQ
jgi:hypothetical protein